MEKNIPGKSAESTVAEVDENGNPITAPEGFKNRLSNQWLQSLETLGSLNLIIFQLV